MSPDRPPGVYENGPAVTPNYDNAYNPGINGPIHAPRWTPPVKRKRAPVDHIRIGNQTVHVKDVPWPSWMSKKDREKAAVSGNDWFAFFEAEITRGLISIGVPEDEASRKAAAAVLGGAVAGAAGGTAAFLATTVVVGVVTVPIGALIGTGVGAAISGGNPIVTLQGTGLGALGGGGLAVAAGLGVGTFVGVLSAIGGAFLGEALGAGDPGKTAKRPKLPWEKGSPRTRIVITNPDANQFEAHLPAPAAKQIGLPAVDYVFTKRGDVSLSVGNAKVGRSAEQAQAPIKALGAAAPGAERAINDGVRTVSRELSKAVPGLNIGFPQEKPVTKSPSKAKH